MNDKKKIDHAIDKLNKGMDDAIEGVKNWIADIVVADDRPPNWEIDFSVLTPEEEAKRKTKREAAHKRAKKASAADELTCTRPPRRRS